MELHRNRIAKAFYKGDTATGWAEEETVVEKVGIQIIESGLEVSSEPEEEVSPILPEVVDRLKDPKDKFTLKDLNKAPVVPPGNRNL